MPTGTTSKKNPWVGVAELCAWISAETQRPCTDITTSMKDGMILSSLLVRVFPSLSLYRSKANPSDPWPLIQERSRFLQLPQCLCDWHGMQGGKFPACYAIVVALFFIHHLADQADYSADFAHDIPADVSAFLQSMSCVEVMVRGGAMTESALVLPESPPPGQRPNPSLTAGIAPVAEDAAGTSRKVPQALSPLPVAVTTAETRSLVDRFDQFKHGVRHEGLQRELGQLRAHVSVLHQVLAQHGLEAPVERPSHTWSDQSRLVRGEFVLRKVMAEVEGLRHELRYEREAHREKEDALRQKMDMHRVAWLEHQERQRRQTAEELESLRFQHSAEMNALREQHRKDLTALKHDADMQYEQFMFETENEDPSRLAQELITLRKMRMGQAAIVKEMEDREVSLAQSVTSQRESFKEMLRTQTASQDALYHSLLGLLDDGPSKPPCDPDSLLKALSAKTSRLEGSAATAQVSAENENLKRKIHEMELLHELPNNTLAELERNICMHNEIEALKQRVASLTKTNEFLCQQRSTGSLENGGGTSMPTVTGDLAHHASTCYSYVQQLTKDEPFKSLLQQSFWVLVAHCGTIQRKCNAVSTNLEVVTKENTILRKQLAEAKTQSEREIFDCKISAQTERERLESAAAAEKSSLSAEIQLLKNEVDELREQTRLFAKKYKAVMQAAAAENESQYDTIRARHRHATRALTSAKVRESLYRQAVEAQTRLLEKTCQLATAGDYDAATRVNAERQALEVEVMSCLQRIQIGKNDDGDSDPNTPDQLDAMLREASATLIQQRDTALGTLEIETAALHKERSRRAEFEVRLNALEAKQVMESNVVASLEHAIHLASSDRAHVIREKEELCAAHAAELRQLQNRLIEFEVMAAESPLMAKLAPPAIAMARQGSLERSNRSMVSPSPLALSPSVNVPTMVTGSVTPLLGSEIAEARKRIASVLSQKSTQPSFPMDENRVKKSVTS